MADHQYAGYMSKDHYFISFFISDCPVSGLDKNVTPKKTKSPVNQLLSFALDNHDGAISCRN